jgi:uncharacterized protein YraI
MKQFMRKIGFSGLGVALAFAAASSQTTPLRAAPAFKTTAASTSARYRVVDAVYLNVRDGASVRYQIIGAIPPAAKGVTIDDCVDNWCHIAWRGVSGWVNARFLRPEAQNLPSWLQSSTR